MKIAIVGPTHPFKGGIAQHTTRLAHQLEGAGLDTYVESWNRQYPAALYPGVMSVPEDEPEVPVFPHVLRRLSWNSPLSWFGAARRLRRADVVIFVIVNTPQLVLYLIIRALLGAGPEVVALMHNVLPHEPKPWDKPAVKTFLRASDHVLVHSAEQREVAQGLTGTPVTETPLPALMDTARPLEQRRRASVEEPLEVLSFGLVRPYKGVDLLIEAMAKVPQMRLTVAGEFWTPAAELRDLAATLGVDDRLTLLEGYVPAAEIPRLFEACHLVALTYRSVTGSGNLKLALESGRPVVVTSVGSLESDVAGRYGVVAEPENVDDLARALRRACEPEEYGRIAGHVAAYPRGELLREWTEYVATIERMLARADE